MQQKKNGRATVTGAIRKTATRAIEQRRLRWRDHVADFVAKADANERGVYIPSQWFEEIERRPIADVIVDLMETERGHGRKAETDAEFDRAPTRTRNAHERECAYFAVMYHLIKPRGIRPEDIQPLIRRFYQAGDCGIEPSIGRAVAHALSMSVKDAAHVRE